MQFYSFKSTTPKKIGQEHGEVFRESVKAMAEIRLELMLREPQFKSKQQVLELAQKHLPILANYDADLYAELLGISEGSGVSTEEIVVLNHYTDMRDLGACTMVFVPSKTGNLLGQTWDIHASAKPYVLLFNLEGKTILTAAGCLGLTGFNQNSVGVCINNLSSLDAQIGLIWPALVRRVLKAGNAQEARDLILKAPLGSGHHYSVADQQDFFGIETSGTQKKVVQSGTSKPHFHTNHCLDPEIAKVSTIRAGSTTLSRYAEIETSLSQHVPENLDELLKLLGRVTFEPKTNDPHAPATCGTFVMNLMTQEYLTPNPSPPCGEGDE
jgi:isopenicillin-N N-acyltransferase-like protein